MMVHLKPHVFDLIINIIAHTCIFNRYCFSLSALYADIPGQSSAILIDLVTCLQNTAFERSVEI